jgi:hypothetical protein
MSIDLIAHEAPALACVSPGWCGDRAHAAHGYHRPDKALIAAARERALKAVLPGA